MTGVTKKKIFKKPSRKTLLISGAVVIVCAAAWLIFGQGIVGDKNVEFKQLSKDDVPKSIETEVIPEYRELERALGCLIDGKVYVIVTRGEKPTAGYEVSIRHVHGAAGRSSSFPDCYIPLCRGFHRFDFSSRYYRACSQVCGVEEKRS